MNSIQRLVDFNVRNPDKMVITRQSELHELLNNPFDLIEDEVLLAAGLLHESASEMEWLLTDKKIRKLGGQFSDSNSILGLSIEENRILVVTKDNSSFALNDQPYAHAEDVLNIILHMMRITFDHNGHQYCSAQERFLEAFYKLVEKVRRSGSKRLKIAKNMENQEMLLKEINSKFNSQFVKSDMIAMYDDTLVGVGKRGIVFLYNSIVSYRRGEIFQCYYSDIDGVKIENVGGVTTIMFLDKSITCQNETECQLMLQLIELQLHYFKEGRVHEPWKSLRIKKQ